MDEKPMRREISGYLCVEKSMTPFNDMSADEIISYLIQNFDEFGAGNPDPSLRGRLERGMANNAIALECSANAFAFIARANRVSPLPGVVIPPESELMFIMTSLRGHGIGTSFLRGIKAKYMEGQSMMLTCYGERRRAFFEASGFVVDGHGDDGALGMRCDVAIEKD